MAPKKIHFLLLWCNKKLLMTYVSHMRCQIWVKIPYTAINNDIIMDLAEENNTVAAVVVLIIMRIIYLKLLT